MMEFQVEAIYLAKGIILMMEFQAVVNWET